MNRAQEIIDLLLGEAGAAPAPTIAPPRPGVKPGTAPPQTRPRPGTRPWNPSIRPGINPRPKARKPGEEISFAEANTSVPVPPPPTDEDPAGTPEPAALPSAGQGINRFVSSHTPPPPAPEPETQGSSLTDYIRPGDRVVIQVPAGMGRHGQEWKSVQGRAVMRNRQTGTWAVNLGGPHGRPGVASDENIVQIRRGGKVIYGKR
jgi:hypothetical protein